MAQLTESSHPGSYPQLKLGEKTVALLWIKKASGIYPLGVAAALFASPGASQATPLSFVDIDAHAISCLFSRNCKISSHDTAGDIPLPSSASGKAWLRSRTFRGARGSPAAGKRGYQYQVDLTHATSLADAPCVTELALDFGEIIPLKYGSAGFANHGYVVARGESPSVRLFAAETEGNIITFTFNEPVCAGINDGSGLASYFVGVTSVHSPKSIVASIRLPGQPLVKVKARVPDH